MSGPTIFAYARVVTIGAFLPVLGTVYAQAITLPDAIRRAEANEPTYAAVRAEARAASVDRGIARSALLPAVVYHNQALYTQPNGAINQAGPTGSQSAPIFIANNAVREYASQASVTETVGLAQVAGVRAADAASARANAELEVSRRGLVAAVSGLFYGVLMSERRLAVLTRARDEAANFKLLTEQREAAREAAHADAIKAELTLQQRERDLAEGKLARDRARLELGVLLFPDPLTPYTLDEPSTQALPLFSDVEMAARHGNPELASALAALRQSDAEVLGAQAALLPDLVLNFSYGIDATTFATATRDRLTSVRTNNLGYSFGATLDIPVWDWFATEHRIRQSEVRRDAVRVALSASQRRLIADLRENYAEAQTAGQQLASLDTSVRTADESLRLTRLRYTSGEAMVLEVVDAQTASLGAQTAREDGQVRYEQALSSLQTLTGIL